MTLDRQQEVDDLYKQAQKIRRKMSTPWSLNWRSTTTQPCPMKNSPGWEIL